VRVIEGGRAAEPEEINYDQPTVIRRRPRQATAVTVESNTAENLDYLDIPAFLRRQAD
jgi:cell division protein FtsZ